MSDLGDYVRTHTVRGECQCGLCIDKGDRPDPEGHTVDMVFFKVALYDDPTPEEFARLTQMHPPEFGNEVNPWDGREHNYLELGGWIGDQGLAMQYMALGVGLGIFHLLSPDTILPGLFEPDHPDRMKLAQSGVLAVQDTQAPDQ